jgi:hypothetical protein
MKNERRKAGRDLVFSNPGGRPVGYDFARIPASQVGGQLKIKNIAFLPTRSGE